MTIEFDDEVARQLGTCAGEIAQALRGSAWGWRSCAEDALDDFHGGYAEVFTATRVLESGDRNELARSLDALAEQLWIVGRQAHEEQERQADLASWRRREADREAARALDGGAVGAFLEWGATIVDRKPSEVPVRPSPISASFRSRHRARTGGGRSGGRSGADPAKLRRFTASARSLNRTAEQDLVRFRNAWSAFNGTCGWVPIDSSTLPGGFRDHVLENDEDAAWMERVAAAFEAAGGGASLSNAALDTMGTSTLPAGMQALLDPTIDSAAVAAAWAALGLTDADVRALSLELQLRLANLDGLPASTRDIASRAVLRAALRDPGKVYRMLGFASAPSAISLETFTEQIRALRDGLDRTDIFAQRLKRPSAGVAQLVGFGESNGAVVAAIALGDLDTASNVSVNVPGALTTVDSAAEKVEAANSLLVAADRMSSGTDSFAMVSWFGYRTPDLLRVPRQHLATSGAVNLARFLDGVHDSRGGAPRRLTVLGHSYGSTTSAEALEQTRYRVDNFVTYGSAGLPDRLTPDRLHADRVFATKSSKDWLAGFGLLSGRDDPRSMLGVQEFSAEDTSDTKGVTIHDMYPPGSDHIGYLSNGSTTQRAMASILATDEPG